MEFVFVCLVLLVEFVDVMKPAIVETRQESTGKEVYAIHSMYNVLSGAYNKMRRILGSVRTAQGSQDPERLFKRQRPIHFP